MRKYTTYTVFVALLLTVAFSSCRREPLPEAGDAIRFSVGASTDVEVETKAGPTTITNFQSSNIALYGSYVKDASTVTLFDGTTTLSYTASTTTWTYTPLKYWVNGGTYDFRAVSPATAPKSGGSAGTSTGAKVEVDYNASSDQYDLMVASNHGISVSSPASMTPVNLPFSHACAAVQFLFKKSGNETGKTCTITSFKLSGTNTKGTMTYAYSASDTKDVLSWSPNTIGDLFAATGTSWAVTTSFSSFDGWHYVVPQTFSGATVQYTYVFDGDAAKTVTLSLPAVTWEPGKAYKYTIDIGISKIDVQIESWDAYPVWVTDIPFPDK